MFTLTDTVGFVRHLPHQLVESFRSTLEEIAEADLVLHVVDGSDAQPEEQVSAVREVLAEIDATKVPEIIVVNKLDAADPVTIARLRHALPGASFVSARTGEGIAALRERVAAALPAPPVPVHVLVPFTVGIAGLPGALRGHGAGRGAHRRRHAADRQGPGGAGGRARAVRGGRHRMTQARPGTTLASPGRDLGMTLAPSREAMCRDVGLGDPAAAARTGAADRDRR